MLLLNLHDDNACLNKTAVVSWLPLSHVNVLF